LAESRAQARSPIRFTAGVARGLRESAVIAIGVAAIVLLIALATYSPCDSGYSVAGACAGASNLGVHNRIGPVGAWLADVLFFAVGRPAFLLPFMLGLSAWMLHRGVRGEPTSRANSVVRAAGFLLLLAASCGLTAVNWQHMPPAGPGGVIGSEIGSGLADGLKPLGATLLLLAAWMAGLSLSFEVSWFTVMDRLGSWTWAGIGWLRERRASAKDVAVGKERRAARRDSVVSEQKRVAARPPPKIEPPTPSVEKSERVERERQVPLFDPPKAGELPPLSLLDDPPAREPLYSAEALEALSRLVEMKLKDFDIEAEVVAVQPGPVVTRFELRPAPGVKASQITSLSKDLARALSVLSVRVVEVIPGKSVMGLEIANEKREIVTLGEIIRSKAYDEMHSPIALALGKDIGGQPYVADLARMPHLLIAGTTGSGKSVAINAMVLSLLYKSTAEHVRLIMIDPKMLELSVYEGIPHLLSPVVTDMKQAANALRWCVAEMERRYQLMAALGVRNIGGFNRKVKDAADGGKPIKDPIRMAKIAQGVPGIVAEDVEDLTSLPFVVVIIDELADLMMIVGKKVEELIARLAQKARASGIHLILATQRPSVDVITGLIKANIPTRIAFQVSAKVDSRTILDQSGAESLLGHGDMLYLPPGTSIPTRVHGAFVSDQEVHRVVAGLKSGSAPTYIDEILEGPSMSIPGFPADDEEGGEGGAADAEADPLYDEAVKIVTETRKASISGVQRRLKIGYNRAARLVEAMEAAGLVGPLQSNGAREIFGAPPPEE
jgi:S-DNA-T family DNA segregation ATPase FtsK/SpoIIIE